MESKKDWIFTLNKRPLFSQTSQKEQFGACLKLANCLELSFVCDLLVWSPDSVHRNQDSDTSDDVTMILSYVSEFKKHKNMLK